jgi:hypothetical protein
MRAKRVASLAEVECCPAAFLAQATLLPAQAYDIEQIRHIAQVPVGLGLWSAGAGRKRCLPLSYALL